MHDRKTRKYILVSTGLLTRWGKRLYAIGKGGKEYSGQNKEIRDLYEGIINVSSEFMNYWANATQPAIWVSKEDVGKWIETLRELSLKVKDASVDHFDLGRYYDIRVFSDEIEIEIHSYLKSFSQETKAEMLKALRDEIEAHTTSKEVTTLDRFQGILTVVVTALFGAFGYFLGTIAFVVYSQVFLSVVFIVIYGIGWAKHALDLRILGIASFFQFLYLGVLLIFAYNGYSVVSLMLVVNNTESVLAVLALTAFGLLIYAMMTISSKIGYEIASRTILRNIILQKEDNSLMAQKMTYLVRGSMPRVIFHLSVLGFLFIFQYPFLLQFVKIQFYLVLPFIIISIEWYRQITRAQDRFLGMEEDEKSPSVQNPILAMWILFAVMSIGLFSLVITNSTEPPPLLFLAITANLICIGILSDVLYSSSKGFKLRAR